MKGHILLTCYDFPPNPGIGGRRWAKFAKSLASTGYTVHVIKAEFPPGNEKESNWAKDVFFENIKIYSLPRLYPTIITRFSDSIVNKILFRIARYALYVLGKGTVYDRALFWKKQYLEKANFLIKKYSIKNVIVTGAPFRLLYYAALLKNNNKNIRLICDYRDPWIEPGGAYGVASLNNRKLNQEKYFEEKVYRYADYISAPSEYVINPNKYGLDISSKVKIITHSYDPEDIPGEQVFARNHDMIKIIYGGALYEGIEEILYEFRNAVSQLKTIDSQLYNKIKLDFYTPDIRRRNFFEGKLENKFNFHNYLSKDKLFEQLGEADICLMFLPKKLRHFKSTKFFEIVAMRKPFLFLGCDGEVSRFIKSNKLGGAIEPGKMLSDFPQFVSDYDNDKINYNYDFDCKQYSLAKVRSELESLFV